MASSLPRAGDLIDGRYKILKPLGIGGYAVVFKAEQISTGQLVAIKLLLPEKLGRAKAHLETARFEREMRLIAKLKHPNMVRLIDSGSVDERLYTVLEFIDGQELSSLVQRQGTLTLDETLDLMTQVLEALSVAHELGVVHRDLKPQNIMVSEAGYRRSAMVLDFGIAGIVSDARDESYVALTTQNTIHGSPAYMAPEQFTKLTPTPAIDIYAWGLVFLECLTGRIVAMRKSLIETAAFQRSKAPVVMPDELDHPKLRAILETACAKRLHERYPSAREALADLEAAGLTGSRVNVNVDVAPPEPSKTPSRRSPLTPIVVVLSLIALALGAVLIYRALNRDAAPAPAEEPAAPRDPVEPPPEVAPVALRLAVLPVADASKTTSYGYLADGLTDILIERLAAHDELAVIPRAEVFEYEDAELWSAASALEASHVVTGHLEVEGDAVEVVVQMHAVEGQALLWSATYERALDDLLDIQGEMVQKIDEGVTTTLLGDADASASADATGTESLEAHRLYRRARFIWGRRTKEALASAIALMDEALALDPGYIDALSAQAEFYVIQAWYGWAPSVEAYEAARVMAETALALQPDVAEAFSALAFVTLFLERDFDAAERHFLDAIEARSDYASAHQWYAGNLLAITGRFIEAEFALNRALTLEPLSSIINTDLGELFYYQRRFEDAQAQLDKILALEPDYAVALMQRGRVYLALGEVERAVDDFERAREEAPDSTWAYGWLAVAYGAHGDRRDAKRIRDDLEARAEEGYLDPYHLALVYLSLEELDDFYAAMNDAVDSASAPLMYLAVEPLFDPLREDPRFVALLERLHLTHVDPTAP